MTPGTVQPLSARTGLPLLAIILLAAAGCGGRRPGPPLVPVTGRVTLDGQPMQPGIVTFFDAELQGTSAMIGPDGRYRVVCDRGPGLAAGEYKVTVQAIEPAADPSRPSLPHELPHELVRPPTRPSQTVPTAFQSRDRTPLRFTVSPSGDRELVFDVPLMTETAEGAAGVK